MRFTYPNLIRALLIGLLCLLSTATLSQSTLAPLFLRFEDTIWQWTETGGLQEIVTLPPNVLSFSLSPNQQYIVYERYTEFVLAECFDDQGNGLGCAGPDKFPTDIFAIDLQTGQTLPITTPPGPDQPEPGRSSPAWSPDGTRLAWTEGYDEASLLVYDFQSNETTLLVDSIITRGLPGVSATVAIAAWIDTGIVFFPEIVDEVTGKPHRGYRVYNATDGRLLVDAPPIDGITGGYFATIGTTKAFFTDREYVNLQTGEILPTPNGLLTRYANGWRASSLRVHPPVLDENGVYHYAIYSVDGVLLTTLDDINPFFFAPTGTAIAYRSPAGIAVWRPDSDGGPFEIALPQPPDWFRWGTRTGYEFTPGGETYIASARCENSLLPFRMWPNRQGYVLGDTPNNVRSAPDTGAALAGQLPPGVPFTIVSGPVCAAGLAWWEVDNPSGWTAEGQGTEYWIQPGCPESGCG